MGSELQSPSAKSAEDRPQWAFAALGFVLIACFGSTLYDVARFSLRTELFSHILLIPLVTGYLIWIKRSSLPATSAPDRRIAGFVVVAAVVILAWNLVYGGGGVEQDQLAWKMLVFVLLLLGLCAVYMGRLTLRSLAFPLGFLVFVIPLPVAWVDVIESFLQHRSASAAALLFKIAGTPFFREETFFQLPGINLQVAPECSGIRSSLALFITSLVAGYLFLRSPGRRAILALAVIPLAIVRNGFRVFVIGELCVHVSPDMIDSYIHHHGGPIFFALSLIPFFLLLWILVRTERPRHPAASPSAPVSSAAA